MNAIKKLLIKFWHDNRDKLIEAGKAAARYLIFLSVAWGISYVGELPTTQSTFIGLSILTFVDKWLHENWKENNKTGIRGISPF